MERLYRSFAAAFDLFAQGMSPVGALSEREAIRGELRAVRERNTRVLSLMNLDRIGVTTERAGRAREVATCDDTGIHLRRGHRLVAAALARHHDDSLLVSVLASAIYTALNIRLEEVTDADEAVFVEHLAEHINSGL